MNERKKYNTSDDETEDESWNWYDDPEEIELDRRFNIIRFDKEFVKRPKEFERKRYLKHLQKMDADKKSLDKKSLDKKSLYKQSILELAINTKDAWFELMDDLLDQQFTVDTIVKNNRLFYIGITIFIISIIIYLYDKSIDRPIVVPDNIQTIYHIYPPPTHMQPTPYPATN